MVIKKTKGWLTKITNIEGKEEYQVRIDSSTGYFYIIINPETKESWIGKDRQP
jgi:hypothetical protein